MTDEDTDDATGERGERIAKWAARAGVASRRDIERMIAEGRIKINGKLLDHPASFVTDGDIVQVDGKVVDAPSRTRLFRYHKPAGLVTTHKDRKAGRRCSTNCRPACRA